MRPLSSTLPLFLVLFGVISVSTLRSIEISYGFNQLVFFLVAGAAYLAVSSMPVYWLKRSRYAGYFLVLVLLLATLIIGRATNGSVSWIRLGAYRLQPSEFLKPVLILLLAFEAGRWRVDRWTNIVRFALLATIPLFLVLIQPDLGTSLIVLTGIVTVFLLSRPKKQHVFLLGVAGLAVAALAWIAVLKPYQHDRILTFLNPTSDPLGSGYNAQQAMIAVGAGGWFGTGFGNGAQSHLRFLPERQTDFLFATYAEETGLAGSLLLLSLYTGLYGWLVFRLSQLRHGDQFVAAAGILAMFLMQSFINIGMNIGIAPITGVTLPFFSLGGSSLLSSAISLGIIESLRRSDAAASASLS